MKRKLNMRGGSAPERKYERTSKNLDGDNFVTPSLLPSQPLSDPSQHCSSLAPLKHGSVRSQFVENLEDLKIRLFFLKTRTARLFTITMTFTETSIRVRACLLKNTKSTIGRSLEDF